MIRLCAVESLLLKFFVSSFLALGCFLGIFPNPNSTPNNNSKYAWLRWKYFINCKPTSTVSVSSILTSQLGPISVFAPAFFAFLRALIEFSDCQASACQRLHCSAYVATCSHRVARSLLKSIERATPKNHGPSRTRAVRHLHSKWNERRSAGEFIQIYVNLLNLIWFFFHCNDMCCAAQSPDSRLRVSRVNLDGE